MKKISFSLFFVLFTFLFVSLINVNAEDVQDVFAGQPEVTPGVIEGATYRVEETLAEEDLGFGVKYWNDFAYSSITKSELVIGNACGASIYGSELLYKDKEYTQSAYLMSIPANSDVMIVPWQMVSGGQWQLQTVINIAKDFELHNPEYKVIGGINGSFFDINGNNPYRYTSNGSISSLGDNYKLLNGERAVSFTNDENNTILRKVGLTKSSRPFLEIYDADGNSIYKISVDKTNQEPVDNEISVFYALCNDNHTLVKIDVTDSYVVQDKNAYTVAYSSSTYYGKGSITSIGDATLGLNQFAIKTNNEEIKEKLAVGTTIRVQYEFVDEFKDCTNVIHYADAYVLDNKEVILGTQSDYSDYRYPRTLVGRKADGTIIMCCTDGRQGDKGYYGLNGTECAAQMMYYGCEEVYGFDGGGSTSMAVLIDGVLQYVNSGSDGNPRSDGNAMLVVVKAPNINVEYKSTETSVSFTSKVLSMIDGYEDLYIELNGEMKKLTNDVTFDGLDIRSSYKYRLYSKIDEEFVPLPYGGTVLTAKGKFELDKIKISTNGDKFNLKFSFVDEYETIINSVILVNGKRCNISDKVAVVDSNIGLPLYLNSTVKVTYDLDNNDKRLSVEINDFSIEYEDGVSAICSLFSEFPAAIDKLID